MEPSPTACRVARFIQAATWESFPQAVRVQTVRCLLDVLGTSVAGRATELSKIAHDFAADVYAGRGAVLWQDGRAVSPPGAALGNGMTIDSLDIHDGHPLTKGHAGAAIVPAAFAAIGLEDGTLSGRELLTLIAVGYEVALRAGICLHATAGDYHTSGAWNALGCAAVVARRLSLSEEQTLNALGIAEYHGPRSPMMRCIDHPTMLKDGSGWGAMTGVAAGLLARSGFTGRPAATVEFGDVEKYWNDLGERWEMLDQYFKPHAVCRWAQPAVEGAMRLKRRHGIESDDVAAIRVATFHEAVRLAVRRPTTTEEAQYSLPFPLAAILVHGELGPEQLCGAGLADERVLRLAELVELEEDDELSRRFPARRYAHVCIVTGNGQRREARFAEPRWDADSPADDDELIAKFRRLCQRLPQNRVAELERTVLDLPQAASVDRLSELMALPC